MTTITLSNSELAVFLMSYLAFALILYVLLVIAFWKIFTKMGEPGWKSIIPFYNLYVIFKNCWKTSMFWVALVLLLAGSFVAGMGQGMESSFIMLGGQVVMLVGAIVVIMGEYYLYKSFGHGIGWLILSIFIPNILMLVLGFGSSQYLGNGSKMQ